MPIGIEPIISPQYTSFTICEQGTENSMVRRMMSSFSLLTSGDSSVRNMYSRSLWCPWSSREMTCMMVGTFSVGVGKVSEVNKRCMCLTTSVSPS